VKILKRADWGYEKSATQAFATNYGLI